MASNIDDAIRLLVAERADYRCEYCLLSEADAFCRHQVDHIISRKHGGTTEESNLAFACIRCNAWKGSDIGSVDPQTGQLVSFYHPREQRWRDHFRLDGAVIEPLTAEARVTARMLRLNIDQRIVERRLLLAVGRYSHA